MDTSNKMPKFPRTYWREIELPKFDNLKQDLTVDVAIVGAGITGVTAAYLLSKEGVNVAIVEAGSILNGTTGHTTAKISAQHGLIYDEYLQHFGAEVARLYYESQMSAIEFIENTVKEHQIECDFSKQDAYLFATTDQYKEKLQKEWQAYQQLNIDGELTEKIPFDIEVKAALMMKNQAQFHPLTYLKDLLNAAVSKGCQVFENTTALDIEEVDEGKQKVITNTERNVVCNHVIIASHFPFYDLPGLYFGRMYAERSYLIGIKTEKEYPGGMYISVDEPIRSIRYTPLENGEKLLIIGGERHKTGQGVDTLTHYEALATFAEEVFGMKEYQYRWSAQDLTTLDKMPYIGPITSEKEQILVATGYKKWGMTTGTVAAQVLADYILKRDNPYSHLYHPSRFHSDPDIKNFIKDNADVAKHLIKGKLEFVPKGPEDLITGEGSVVMYNGKRAGGYKDENGKLFVVDTTCTHLGCECEWNHAEKTWDCPCHGSRYSYAGDVVEGPAVEGLKKLSE